MASQISILSSGQTLGGFRIDELIGVGGMAVVYRAEQLSLGRPVALKVLSERLARDELFRERFRREGKHAAALEHPNIVPVYDSGEQEGMLYLAMRLVEGTNLAELILAAELDADGTLDVLRPIAGALDSAHAEGLVHRDVKPQNILITQRGHPYLADFGVAKGSNTYGLTASGRFVGSVNYASPEQISGETLTAASDIYALAAVLYHCLTGEVPYPRETDAAIMHAHLHEPPPPLPAPREGGANATESAALNAVLARGMAKAPAARYERAQELMGAITPLLKQLPSEPRRTAPAFPATAEHAKPARRISGGQRRPVGRQAAGLELTAADRRRPRVSREAPAVSTSRWRWPVLAAGAAVLAMTGGTLLLVLPTSHKPRSAPQRVPITTTAPHAAASRAVPSRPLRRRHTARHQAKRSHPSSRGSLPGPARTVTTPSLPAPTHTYVAPSTHTPSPSPSPAPSPQHSSPHNGPTVVAPPVG
ncbi:MAG TPA: protein kinase [Solirubrobacteraceae bacterium]|nr:protein kinase [Solirubrobacteraceae bacterium]